jgi:hypothetical protein
MEIRRVKHSALCGVSPELACTSHPVIAQDVSSQSLVYATYDGEDTAGQVFKTMKQNQSATGERILSYAIVSKDLKERSTSTTSGSTTRSRRDSRWSHRRRRRPVGAVAGAAAGGSLLGISLETRLGSPARTWRP